MMVSEIENVIDQHKRKSHNNETVDKENRMKQEIKEQNQAVNSKECEILEEREMK